MQRGRRRSSMVLCSQYWQADVTIRRSYCRIREQLVDSWVVDGLRSSHAGIVLLGAVITSRRVKQLRRLSHVFTYLHAYAADLNG
jgi:hypothetical protein